MHYLRSLQEITYPCSILGRGIVYQDPYTPDRSYYECRNCGGRATAERTPATCPDCDGQVRNMGFACE